MPLPNRPNLEYLKKLAKEELHDLQRADASAQLADAQLAVAREHGFASWRKLRAHLDARHPDGTTPLLAAVDALQPAREPSGPRDCHRSRSRNSTVPSLAAKDGHLGVVKLLIEAGADVNLRSAEGKTALDLAGERSDQAGCVKMVEWLRDRGPRGREDMADDTTTDEEETFIAAIRDGDLGKVKSMLAAKPGLIRSRRHGASPILIARYHGKQEVVECLRGLLPALDIFEAAALGDRERAARLLDGNGGLANAVAEDGFGPLGLASFFDHEPVVRLLLARGARVDAASANDMRVMPLHSAAAAHSVPIARLLLERGAPVNARQGTSGLGFTPLMEAALNGQTEMVDLLLEHGADRTMREDKGHTAGDYARQNGHAALADHLG
jgi:uncharacterized protein